jgi:hypothetical protein
MNKAVFIDQFADIERIIRQLLKVAHPLIIGLVIGLGLCGVDQSLDRLWA